MVSIYIFLPLWVPIFYLITLITFSQLVFYSLETVKENSKSKTCWSKWLKQTHALPDSEESHVDYLVYDNDQRGIMISTCTKILAVCSLTSVHTLSILFSIHFLRCWKWEFVKQSRVSLVGDHFLNSCDPHEWFRGDIVRRNYSCRCLLLLGLKGVILIAFFHAGSRQAFVFFFFFLYRWGYWWDLWCGCAVWWRRGRGNFKHKIW